MFYNYRHQASGIRHQRIASPNVINSPNNTHSRLSHSDSHFHLRFLKNDTTYCYRSSVKNSGKYIRFNHKNCFSLVKRLVLIPLLLLPCTFSVQALSAKTSTVINGSAPYLTFDDGQTKATTTEAMLGITLSDGTVITPASNASTPENPIELPEINQSANDISMLIPVNKNSVAINDLIGAPYLYGRDDDGDDGMTASGTLSIVITDKYDKKIDRGDVFSICRAPYKMKLSSTSGELKTQYGIPNKSTFTDGSATYYIKAKSSPSICYATPDVSYDLASIGNENGTVSLEHMWHKDKGFLTQGFNRSKYGNNFPTTGANKLYFDLDIILTGPLRWPSVTNGGITATMTPNSAGTAVRVLLTGPSATDEQQQSNSPGAVSQPNLPLTFELVGYDSSNKAIVKYGFVLKQWYVHRGPYKAAMSDYTSWCSGIGYRLPLVRELTNAICTASYCQGAIGATPQSTANNYQRYIGAGFATEWGMIEVYTGAGFPDHDYWTSEIKNDGRSFVVYPHSGLIDDANPNFERSGVCVYP